VLTKVDLGLFLASVGRLACFLLVAQENKTLRDLPGCFWRMLGLLDVSAPIWSREWVKIWPGLVKADKIGRDLTARCHQCISPQPRGSVYFLSSPHR